LQKDLLKANDHFSRRPHVQHLDGPGQVIILIGWRKGIGTLLRALDARLPAASEVHILSGMALAKRARELKSNGERTDCEDSLTQITLFQHVGILTSRADLTTLPLVAASAIIIMADLYMEDVDARRDRSEHGSKTQMSDAEVIISCELVQQIRVEQAIKSDIAAEPVCIIPQFLDIHTFRMFNSADNDDLLQSSLADKVGGNHVIPFHRNCIEAGALSISSVLPALGRVLEILSGLEFRVYKQQEPLFAKLEALEFDQFFGQAELLDAPKKSFNEMVDRATDNGLGVVVGWARPRGKVRYRSTLGNQSAPGVTVNPQEKDEKLLWQSGDKVLLIRGDGIRADKPDTE